MEWLSRLDPHYVGGAFGLLVAFGGWALNKARGVRQASLLDTMRAALEVEVLELLESRDGGADVRGRMTDAALAVLDQLKIKPAGADAIVRQAVLWGELELRRRLAERVRADQERVAALAKLPGQLDELAAAAERVAAAFKAPAAPTVPRLEFEAHPVKP